MSLFLAAVSPCWIFCRHSCSSRAESGRGKEPLPVICSARNSRLPSAGSSSVYIQITSGNLYVFWRALLPDHREFFQRAQLVKIPFFKVFPVRLLFFIGIVPINKVDINITIIKYKTIYKLVPILVGTSLVFKFKERKNE